MPVYRYLDLSTAHLTREEAEALSECKDSAYDLRTPLPRVIAHAYGAWMNVPDLEAGDEDADERRAEYPNVQAAIERARSYDCTWINFDRDADCDADLPTYEW